MNSNFNSETKAINAPCSIVYNKLTDLSNMAEEAKVANSDKMQIEILDADSCQVNIKPVGNIVLRIVERIPGKAIRLEAEKSPVPVAVWIHTNEVDDSNSELEVKIESQLNMFIKAMAEKPLRDAADKLAELLSSIRY